MNPNQKKASWIVIAFAAVCAYEGLALSTYPDIGGVPTACYGETKGIRFGQTFTKDQCDENLATRLIEFNNGVNSCVKVELPDTRRAAMVSLAYNIGVPAFCKSTVVRRLNAGETASACDAMLMWDQVKGKRVQGLVNRRVKERELCLRGIAS